MTSAGNTIAKWKVRERAAPALIAVALVLGGVPTAGLAVTAIATPLPHAPGVTPATPYVDPALAQQVAARIAARGQTMRFTPAGTPLSKDRTVTVAIRVDPDAARAISVRSAIAATKGLSFAGFMLYPTETGWAQAQQFYDEALAGVRAAGLEPTIVSTGGSPNCVRRCPRRFTCTTR